MLSLKTRKPPTTPGQHHAGGPGQFNKQKKKKKEWHTENLPFSQDTMVHSPKECPKQASKND